ncbi:8871_t:CDS:2 [Scutellospora calospora]|uniref:8871_t:CDS:1 n=1 Tax=Scutellospora calospora TaxID=85575 RepID=A0ACA9JXB6_9GLOM|nr:8871_t:CDS:2 [Scutellospora calospora]
MNVAQIQEHVLGGKREHLNFEREHLGLREEKNSKTWAQNSASRPVIREIRESLYGGKFTIHNMITIKILPSLDIVIQKHKETVKLSNPDFESLWKWFDKHASLGSDLGKYSKAYYIYKGYFVKQNLEDEKKTFLRRADNGLCEAQLKYMKLLSSENEDKHEIFKYIMMASNT